MDKAEHAKRLRGAMAAKGLDRETVADATAHNVRTVTNWTRGFSMPSEGDRAILRRLLGPYDSAGDPVELAIQGSPLTRDRQLAVLSLYERLLREQRQDDAV
jgi:hypothetical protein